VAIWRAKEEHQHSCEVKSRTRAERAEAALREARELLWLGHGHSGPALYGDDGEMQCSGGGYCDFKRATLEEIRDHMNPQQAMLRAALRDTAPAEEQDFSWFRGEVDKELVQKLVDMERDTPPAEEPCICDGAPYPHTHTRPVPLRTAKAAAAGEKAAEEASKLAIAIAHQYQREHGLEPEEPKP
jgi:hypothetical protein